VPSPIEKKLIRERHVVNDNVQGGVQVQVQVNDSVSF
jgi:hypothetical protein